MFPRSQEARRQPIPEPVLPPPRPVESPLHPPTGTPPEFHCLEGSNFFRGLALIDLAEAMLKRAFGREAVAVRVNAAGQGDYFQVHVDKTRR